MIIFGLGNPGLRYRFTRHNAGYMLVNRLAREHQRRFKNKPGYRITEFDLKGEPLRLIKPRCWMNQSGVIIAGIMQGENDDFLVVVDDINLPLGRIRLRQKSSDGGHLGLRSIVESMQSSDFMRLRIGVGLPEEDATVYVLSNFSRKEKRLLLKVIKEGIMGIKILMQDGFMKAQNYINSINIELDSNR